MAVTTVDRIDHLKLWQVVLGAAGVIITGAAVAMQVGSSMYHQTTVVSKTGDVTKTTTAPSAPPIALITACLSTGIILILVAAFFSRISKIVIPGVGEIDVVTQASLAAHVAQKAEGNPDEAWKLYMAAAPAVTARLQRQQVARVRGVATQPIVPTPLNDQDISNIVEEAAMRMAPAAPEK